jgi:hypothetical protein
MPRPSSLLLAAALSTLAIPAAAQKMDPAAMQKWASAKVIHYTVEGVYSGETPVTPTMGGLADVVDRVNLNLEWVLGEAKLAGVSGLKNANAEVSKLRDREPKCMPPVLKGPLELTVLEVGPGLGGAIDMKVERSYPTVEVAQFCTASRKTVPASKKVDVYSMTVPSPTMMAMGLPPTKELSFSPDGKSMIVKQGNWSWTFTPSVTKPK